MTGGLKIRRPGPAPVRNQLVGIVIFALPVLLLLYAWKTGRIINTGNIYGNLLAQILVFVLPVIWAWELDSRSIQDHKV